ncbi:hypothetical protein GGX14DRAFT_555099 [Mycena pura]|uniref:MARVEL domain-containing protein n=1 Tax=Mycena pura TaxID=153505 RepID=A0AAD6YTN4_9AGAR|nr:hypothetical protein GGX14DRAFT_555099 [Mycena pura]
MASSFIPLIRLVALSVVVAFAVIVLGLSAALTATTEKYLNGFFEFAALAIATASITMITVSVMIVLEFLKPGRAFTSKIVFELSWLFILWVLWLATAADASNSTQLTFISGCGYVDSVINGACRETAGIQAFAFLNWLIRAYPIPAFPLACLPFIMRHRLIAVMFYTILISTLATIAHARKHSGVWMSSVGEAPFFTPSAATAIPPVQPAAAPAGLYGPNGNAASGAYEPQYGYGVSEGGKAAGPTSVQAGTVHQSV